MKTKLIFYLTLVQMTIIMKINKQIKMLVKICEEEHPYTIDKISMNPAIIEISMKVTK